ncbi:MAG: PBP1A family penicillin-binding protein [Acidimicrobiales bacterium]|nr:PBP1A family penicillin-binding protein [Acidimicrobiales bacterium]
MTERRPPAARPAAKRPPSKGSASNVAPRRARSAVPRPKAGNGRRSALWRWRRSLFVGGLVSVAGIGGVASVVFNINLPPEDALRQTSFVCAADVREACGPDNAIATFSAEEDRINVPLEEVPQVLVDAVLATEDRDFFEHGGVDPVGIARAFYNDVRGRGVRQGGSTITQQYVKNVYLSSERSIARKVKEAVLAVKLERELDKEQILERYLNTIYFGRGAYGVGAASRAYFGTDVRGIGLPEAAYLAGLIRAPEAADPATAPEEATRRRETSLAAMASEGHITEAEQAAASAVPWEGHVIARRDRSKLDLVPELETIGGAYFLEEVRQQVAEKYGEGTLYGGGLRIYLTLDTEMQEAAWDAVTSTLDQPDDPAAALVAIDDLGQIKAMVGGRDIEAQEVNYALGKDGGGSGRGAGSSFKPFVLAAALQKGISLNSKFNAPAEITLPKANGGKDWVVGNYDESEQGVLDLVDATRVSSNTAYAQLMLKVGPDRVIDLAHDMGVSSELEEVNSLVLGTGDVSVLDMAEGFSTFANRGVHKDATMIAKIEQVDEDGDVRVIQETSTSSEQVLTMTEADMVTHALRQVVLSGTGRAANFGKAAAGKTGTSQENRDAWFVGYTPKLTAAVWMGYPNPPGQAEPRHMDDVHGREVTGGSFPAEIWKKFMRNATAGMDTGSFTAPKAFPGEVLNPQLQTSTTTKATGATSSTTPGASTSSTARPGGSSTTAPSQAPTTTLGTTTTTADPRVCADPSREFPFCEAPLPGGTDGEP